MNKTTWYALLFLVSFNTTLFAMELHTLEAKQYAQLAESVDRLTPIYWPDTYRLYGTKSHTDLLELEKMRQFKAALFDEDSVASLLKVAEPDLYSFTRLIDGRWHQVQCQQNFALADLARGFLLKSQGKEKAAKQAFRRAVHTTHPLRSHEDPIRYVANFHHCLQKRDYDNAFVYQGQLEKIRGAYPLISPIIDIQRQMLADVWYMPLLVQIAQEGSVDAQYYVLQDACKEAVREKTVEQQFALVASCKQYLKTLDQHPEFKSLVEAVDLYIKGAEQHTTGWDQSLLKNFFALLDISTTESVIMHVQKLARDLLEVKAQQGDMQACLYLVARELQSSDKKIRTKGLQMLAPLFSKERAVSITPLRKMLDKFGISSQIEASAKNSNAAACSLWAQLLVTELLENNNRSSEAFTALAVTAKNANTKSCTESELMQSITRFCEAMLLYQDIAKTSLAARKCSEIISLARNETYIEQKTLIKAREMLGDLATDGQLDACIWQVGACLQKDGDAITQETIEYCCGVAKKFLDTPCTALTDEQYALMTKALSTLISKTNNPLANYLMSYVQFRLLHVGCEAKGIEMKESQALNTIFMQAMSAHKAGINEAQSFCKAIGLYRAILMLMDQKKVAEAVDKLLELRLLELPLPAKEIIENFGEWVLCYAAAAGHQKARAWWAQTALKSTDKKNHELALRALTKSHSVLFATHASMDSYAASLLPFKEAGIFDAIVRLPLEQATPVFNAHATYNKSIAFILQALGYSFLMDETRSKEKLVDAAMLLAKEAYELSCANPDLSELKQLFKDWYGAVCLLYGNFLREQNEFERALTVLSYGDYLDHPDCMRARASCALGIKEGGLPMSFAEFISHIDRLRGAFLLGDREAGVILAEHFFEGSSLPFPCGYSIQKNKKRAYEYALKLGPVHQPVIQRILACQLYEQFLLDPLQKDGALLLSEATRLLKEAVNASYLLAYMHFVEIATSELCPIALKEDIISFLQEKEALKIPEAILVSGIILAQDPQRVHEGIKLLREAKKLSNGKLACYELLTYCTHNPDPYMQGELLFEAAKCAVEVINEGHTEEELEISGIPYLLSRLAAVTDEAHTNQATGYYKYLVALLEDLGSTLHHQVPKARAKQPEQEVVTARELAANFTAVEKAPSVLTEMFLSRLQEVMEADDMQSEKVSAIIDTTTDDELMDKIIAAAKEGNPLAQYLHSKLLLQEAEQGEVFSDDSMMLRGFYQQAFSLSGDALASDPASPRFRAHFEYARKALYDFYTEKYVPTLYGNASALNEIFNELFPTIPQLTQPEENGSSNDQIAPYAMDCVYALACNGCIPALAKYVDTFLKSQHKQEQQKALDALCRCCIVYEAYEYAQFVSSGLCKVLQENLGHIKLYADKKNPRAAMIMTYWFGFMACADNVSNAQIQEAVLLGAVYSKFAQKGGVPIVLRGWYHARLHSPMRMPKKEFEKIVKELEAVAEQDVIVGELAMQMCDSSVEYACGQKSLNDKKRCKKIALRIKDKSTKALAKLAQYAKEGGNFKEALLYLLETVKRTREKSGWYDELGKLCMALDVYPDEIESYLKQKADHDIEEAELACAAIGMKRKAFDESVAMLTKIIERGGKLVGFAHLQLAFAYIDKDWSACNPVQSIEHALKGIETLVTSDRTEEKVRIVQLYGIELHNKLLNSIVTRNDISQKQETDACAKLVDMMAKYQFYDSVSIEWLLLMAVRHGTIGTDYSVLVKYIDQALIYLDTSKNKEAHKRHISTAISILLSQWFALVQAASKEGNDDRAQQIGEQILNLAAKAEKSSIPPVRLVSRSEK